MSALMERVEMRSEGEKQWQELQTLQPDLQAIWAGLSNYAFQTHMWRPYWLTVQNHGHDYLSSLCRFFTVAKNDIGQII